MSTSLTKQATVPPPRERREGRCRPPHISSRAPATARQARPLMEPAQVMLTGPRTRAVSQKRGPPAVHSSPGKPLQRAQVQLRQELPPCTNAKTQPSTAHMVPSNRGACTGRAQPAWLTGSVTGGKSVKRQAPAAHGLPCESARSRCSGLLGLILPALHL